MSVSKVSETVTAHTVGGYSFYSIKKDTKKYIIGGVPQAYSDSYIAEALDASAIILLTSKPEFCGGVGEAVDKNPDLEIYATPAGLRNIKEITNRDINECIIKDTADVCGIKFITAPNLTWVDTCLVIYDGILFSGELFSGADKKSYFNERLAVNRGFVESAVDRVKALSPACVCPAVGGVCTADDVINEYKVFLDKPCKERKLISVIYNSEYGFTRAMAEYVKDSLPDNFDVYFSEASDADTVIVNMSDALIIGTNTINRNAPQNIWNIITGLDLVNNRQMPYLVFGSFGWAGDGIKLVDKTLQAMGMNRVTAPVEALFAPSEKDFGQLNKAILKLVCALD